MTFLPLYYSGSCRIFVDRHTEVTDHVQRRMHDSLRRDVLFYILTQIYTHYQKTKGTQRGRETNKRWSGRCVVRDLMTGIVKRWRIRRRIRASEAMPNPVSLSIFSLLGDAPGSSLPPPPSPPPLTLPLPLALLPEWNHCNTKKKKKKRQWKKKLLSIVFWKRRSKCNLSTAPVWASEI